MNSLEELRHYISEVNLQEVVVRMTTQRGVVARDKARIPVHDREPLADEASLPQIAIGSLNARCGALCERRCTSLSRAAAWRLL